MSITPIFKTNLAMIPNTTKLLLCGEVHDYEDQRLYTIRSIQHLAKQNYNSFLFEAASKAESAFNENYKNFSKIVKLRGKEALSYFISMNKENYGYGRSGILKWEADAFKIKTYCCDDDEFGKNTAHLDFDANGITSILVKTVQDESVRLKLVYGNFANNVQNDLRYAMYGPKTFVNHVKDLDVSSDYKTEVATIGNHMRNEVVKFENDQAISFKLTERNLFMAKKINNAIKINPSLKGYGLFGGTHISPPLKNSYSLPDILEEEYNISSVKVTVSSLNNMNLVSKKMNKIGLDLKPICPEEVLSLSKIFGLNPLELSHLLKGNIADISEGIYEVDNQKFGVDYEVILPAFEENDYKTAVVKKICSKF